jgi:type I restriction enzyme S subunit
MSWPSIEFPKAIRKTKVGRENQILSADILPSGSFPVIDQGQAFIAGYSDAEERVIRSDLPMVIFGDHTRCVKYVNFPFILGADGTKVLKPKEDLFDPKFFYYALLSLDIPNRGYNRHFTVLKEKTVPCPEKDEQRKIAVVLGVVQRAIEQQEQLFQLTVELKKTLLHKLFTQGLRSEPQKQTEIGPVPESWGVVKIGSLGKVVTGTTPKTKVPEYYSPAEVDFIAPADLGQTRQIYNSEKKISRRGLDVIRGLPKDAVMCVCIGSSIGKVGMTSKADSATNQQINSIICNEKHDPAFVYYLLSYFTDYWRGFATFGPVPILSKGSFEAIDIVVPRTKDEEAEIARYLTALDAKLEVHMRRKNLLIELFRTLLHELMTAQIRTNGLDLSDLIGKEGFHTS